MTTRRWMIVVAAVAVIMTLGAARRKQRAFQRLAAYHEKELSLIVPGRGTRSGNIEIWLRHDPSNGTWRLSSAGKAAYHSRMRDIYARSARYPWLAFDPDPPQPK
jgi:hypothetical protein